MEPILKVGKASPRNTPCFYASFLGVNVVYSYETPIGVCGYDSENRWVHVRRDNDWGPTTGRHINEAIGKEVKAVGKEEFNDTLNQLLLAAVANYVKGRIA